MTIANANASSRTIEVWLVPNGGSATDATLIVPGVTIEGKSLIQIDFYQVLDTAGDTIQAEASAASSITITVSGAEIT